MKVNSIDSYIAGFEEEHIRKLLEKVRTTIAAATVDAEEVISYGMPAFRQNGILVFFAAHKKHIGFYPTASGIENFTGELKDFKTSKGAVQFPFDKPIPYQLIAEITRFRVEEQMKKANK